MIVLALSVAYSIFLLVTPLQKVFFYLLPYEVLANNWKLAYYFILHQGKLLFVIVLSYFCGIYDILYRFSFIHESSNELIINKISYTNVLILPTIKKNQWAQKSIKAILTSYQQQAPDSRVIIGVSQL